MDLAIVVSITWDEFFHFWLLLKLALLTLKVYWLDYFFQQYFHISNSRKVWFFFFSFYTSTGSLLITENSININQEMDRYFQLKIDVSICIIQECFRNESMATVQFNLKYIVWSKSICMLSETFIKNWLTFALPCYHCLHFSHSTVN